VVDPLSQKFPSADPVPKDLMAEFRPQAEHLLAELPGWESVVPSVQALTSSSTLRED
jgi:hypothetical protein